jgi:hypothetical protein
VSGRADRSTTDETEPQFRIEVRPEPSEEELAALVVALTLALERDGTADTPAAPERQWAMAGRRAAMRGLGTPGGWGRVSGGWRR